MTATTQHSELSSGFFYAETARHHAECREFAGRMADAAQDRFRIDVRKRCRRAEVIIVRRAIILALRQMGFSLPAIAGADLGVRDHTTVLHHVEVGAGHKDVRELAKELAECLT